jgi:hypothetical protein
LLRSEAWTAYTHMWGWVVKKGFGDLLIDTGAVETVEITGHVEMAIAWLRKQPKKRPRFVDV